MSGREKQKGQAEHTLFCDLSFQLFYLFISRDLVELEAEHSGVLRQGGNGVLGFCSEI